MNTHLETRLSLRRPGGFLTWMPLAIGFVLAAQQGSAEPRALPRWTTNSWPVKELGNVRARLAVSEKADAVWAHLPWRRRADNPGAKDIVVVDAATGQRVLNVIRVNSTREAGDLLFQPPTLPGEYHVYYLPYRLAGKRYCPITVYLSPTNTADPVWVASANPLATRLRSGETSGILQARLIEFQAIDDFHRFDPMEIPATANELKQLLAAHRDAPFLLFPEDRTQPIRMTEELPAHWVQTGPTNLFHGAACRGEFYPFQVGLYAARDSVRDVRAAFEDMVGKDGTKIPASAWRCFNLTGTNWLGIPIQKSVNVPKGKVQALWFGIGVPNTAKPQTYHGKVTVVPGNAPEQAIQVRLDVSHEVLADGGDSELWRLTRLRWLDSTIGLDNEVLDPYTPVELRDHTVSVLGRQLRFNDVGLPESIVSTFSRNVDATDAPPRELLAAPIRFAVETAAGVPNWEVTKPKILSRQSGAVAWEAKQDAGPLQLETHATMECDVYVNFKISLKSSKAVDLKEVQLALPLRRDAAVFMMGWGARAATGPLRGNGSGTTHGWTTSSGSGTSTRA